MSKDYKVQWTPELRKAVDDRIIDYLSQGYSQQEAEDKALLDLLDHTTFNFSDDVVVTAKAPEKKQVAVETDWDPGYKKFVSGQRYYADKNHKNYLDWLRNDMTNSIRETTDKWGKGIGLGMTAAVAAPFVVQAAPIVGSALKWGLTTPAGQAATKKFIGDALLGTAGYMGFDEVSKAVTGKTFGQNVADITGNVPVLRRIPYNWRAIGGSFLNPGGYMAVGRGQLAANLLNRAENTAGKVARTSKDYVSSNYNYLKNTKFKGVAEGGNMEAYVPKTVKQNVETGVKGTMQLLENLGVTDLPQITTTYENMPLTGSYMGHAGDLHVGFDSKTLHNPFKYWKVYNEKPGLGINYSFMAGHEPAHLVHPGRQVYYKDGVPLIINDARVVGPKIGMPRKHLIKQEALHFDPKANNYLRNENSYYTAPDELLEAGLFTDINKPRQNIMKGLPNTPQSQAHLRAPMEMDADLYALYNMGHIKNGQVSDEGLKFLMLRHNLSKEGVLNTIDDLQVIEYGNALSREPINAKWIPGNRYTTSSAFGEAGIPATNVKLTSHLQGDDAAQMFNEYANGYILPATETENVRQLRAYVAEARERYGLVGNDKVSDETILKALHKHVDELGGNTAARNNDGEPQLLFRGDTKRYTELKPRVSPEELVTMSGTMDNSLGTLFLGELPGTGVKGQGLERYLVHGREFNGNKRLIGSGTGAHVVSPSGDRISEFDAVAAFPHGSRHLVTHTTSRGIPHSYYKLPSTYSSTGVNDINGFVVRTPNMRNASKEISVLNDEFLVQASPDKVSYYGPKRRVLLDKDGFPLLVDESGNVVGNALAGSSERSAMAQHYRHVLDDAKLHNQGLLKSEGGSTNGIPGNYLRDEHSHFNYFALPNFNIQNAKHILPYDLRIPRNWLDPNIFRIVVPTALTLGGAGTAAYNMYNSQPLYQKQGGPIYSKNKNNGKFSKVRDYVDYKNNK